MVKSVLIAHPVSRKVVLCDRLPPSVEGYGLARRVTLIRAGYLQTFDFLRNHIECVRIILRIPTHDCACHKIRDLNERFLV